MLSPSEIDKIIKSRDPKTIVSRECKHATYSISRDGNFSDNLAIKEWITYDNGDRYPTLVNLENYERPIWITKPHFRTHPEKIQFEDTHRLDMFKSTQIKLSRTIYDKLKTIDPNRGLRDIFNSPYIYGGDQGPEVYRKQLYMNKWPNAFRPNTVSVADAETNVWKEGYDPILWAEMNDEEIILYYDKNWCPEHLYYEDDVRKVYMDALPQYIEALKKKLSDKRKGTYPGWIDDLAKLPLRFVPGDDHFEITKSMVDHLHYTQPDFVTGWNFFFDMKVINDSILKAGRDPTDILSDPRVPKEYRMAYFRKGQLEKISAAGRKLKLGPQETWDVMLTTSSWRPQDSMQLYWTLRKAKGKEPGGYGLDARAGDQLGIGKMHFKNEDVEVPPGTLHWHMEMQKYHKVNYGAYALFDVIGPWAMNKKNSDLSSQISALAGPLDYSQFSSQPKINQASMLFDTLKSRKKVICSTGSEMKIDIDDLTPDRLGWIKNIFTRNYIVYTKHNIGSLWKALT